MVMSGLPGRCRSGDGSTLPPTDRSVLVRFARISGCGPRAARVRPVARTYSPSLDDYDADDASLAAEHQDFTIPYAAVGITPREKVLATDALVVEVLTGVEIAEFEGVPSGETVTAGWADLPAGEHGWNVVVTDPYGAEALSAVETVTISRGGAGEPGAGEPPAHAGGAGPAGVRRSARPAAARGRVRQAPVAHSQRGPEGIRSPLPFPSPWSGEALPLGVRGGIPVGMNDSTTIKVPRALRDRLAVRARQQHSTLAAAIETALDASEEGEFWTRVRSENAALTDEERRARLHDPAAADNLRDPVDDALREDDW
ncbi:hypothetical protein [Georgenia muralis]|uniref:hypothetical protein n=1 Tax=Georgenia muralis TaxID=154117 RepID=UPI001B87409A|nr:hypothetical protein [Georgenia muralis]